ncbi:MAG: hypothetical protein U0744_16525 [Gemmataceae bacterium]
MEKWMCLGALGVSGLTLIVFLLDLVLKIPFGGLNLMVDIFGAAASGLLAYLSLDAYLDVR